MSEKDVIIAVVVSLILGAFAAWVVKDTIISDQPIKLSYTLRCEDGKCDTTYKASTR